MAQIWLKLNTLAEHEVVTFSLLRRIHDPQCFVVPAVGEAETMPFHSQGNAFRALLREQGVPVSVRIVRDRDHMNSVRDQGIHGTETRDLLMGLVQADQCLS